MQLSPNSLIPVAYTTSIPGDTTLYFVQAVLRDTQSGMVLQTLNLKNVSSTPNRYEGVFSPVSDPSGMGRPIDITISVYTDSGYTTLSLNYQILQVSYTILQPWIANLGMGGGMNIDYDKLQKMFDGDRVTNEEIGNEVVNRFPKFDYDRVDARLFGISDDVRDHVSKELDKHSENLISLISNILKVTSDSKEFQEGTESRLNDRIGRLERVFSQSSAMSSKEQSNLKNELISALKEFREEVKKSSADGSKESEKRLKELAEEMQNYLGDNLSEKEIKMVYNMAPQKREKQKASYSPEDLMSLL